MVDILYWHSVSLTPKLIVLALIPGIGGGKGLGLGLAYIKCQEQVSCIAVDLSYYHSSRPLSCMAKLCHEICFPLFGSVHCTMSLACVPCRGGE